MLALLLMKVCSKVLRGLFLCIACGFTLSAATLSSFDLTTGIASPAPQDHALWTRISLGPSSGNCFDPSPTCADIWAGTVTEAEKGVSHLVRSDNNPQFAQLVALLTNAHRKSSRLHQDSAAQA
jgi:hypothetical protein